MHEKPDDKNRTQQMAKLTAQTKILHAPMNPGQDIAEPGRRRAAAAAPATQRPRRRPPLNTSHYGNCRKNVGKYSVRSELKVVSPQPLLLLFLELYLNPPLPLCIEVARCKDEVWPKVATGILPRLSATHPPPTTYTNYATRVKDLQGAASGRNAPPRGGKDPGPGEALRPRGNEEGEARPRGCDDA